MRTKPSNTSLNGAVSTGNPPQPSNTDPKSLPQDAWSSHHPKIFPGIVHERTRRNSVRQGSASENDMETLVGNLRGMARLSVREESEGESCGE